MPAKESVCVLNLQMGTVVFDDNVCDEHCNVIFYKKIWGASGQIFKSHACHAGYPPWYIPWGCIMIVIVAEINNLQSS